MCCSDVATANVAGNRLQIPLIRQLPQCDVTTWQLQNMVARLCSLLAAPRHRRRAAPQSPDPPRGLAGQVSPALAPRLHHLRDARRQLPPRQRHERQSCTQRCCLLTDAVIYMTCCNAHTVPAHPARLKQSPLQRAAHRWAAHRSRRPAGQRAARPPPLTALSQTPGSRAQRPAQCAIMVTHRRVCLDSSASH